MPEAEPPLLHITTLTTGPNRGAVYYDERVCRCVYVCLYAILSSELQSDLHHIFMFVTYGRGSVLLWRPNDTLRISGFKSDVILQ